MRRWILKWKFILGDFVTGVGLFWLIVEIASYSTDGKSDAITKSIVFFLIAALAIALLAVLRNRPKTAFTYQLRDKDNILEVRVGDAFKNDGALVIPVNTNFDVCMGGNVIKARSLLSKLIAEYCSAPFLASVF